MRDSISEDKSSVQLTKKLSQQKKKKPVDPDDLNSNSDDETNYPGFTSKEKRLAKMKKLEEDITS